MMQKRCRRGAGCSLFPPEGGEQLNQRLRLPGEGETVGGVSLGRAELQALRHQVLQAFLHLENRGAPLVTDLQLSPTVLLARSHFDKIRPHSGLTITCRLCRKMLAWTSVRNWSCGSCLGGAVHPTSPLNPGGGKCGRDDQRLLSIQCC